MRSPRCFFFHGQATVKIGENENLFSKLYDDIDIKYFFQEKNTHCTALFFSIKIGNKFPPKGGEMLDFLERQ